MTFVVRLKIARSFGIVHDQIGVLDETEMRRAALLFDWNSFNGADAPSDMLVRRKKVDSNR
ncbi:MAG: hypothetical protein OXG15_04915 [Gammaproteobacteria bacterium]|nr:hypothetical protein [Gammaproteobacteria bacterium]